MASQGTVSMHTETYTKSQASAVIRHTARSLEAAMGIYKNHSNEAIDTRRILENFVVDADGNPLTSTDEIFDRISARQGQRKNARKLRENQKVFCETILQIDPTVTGLSTDWVAGNTAGEAELSAMVEWVVEKVGKENVTYVSLHLDETNPHIHVGWVPLAEDRSLDWRKVLGELRPDSQGRVRGVLTPKMWSQQHDELHDYLREKTGYEVVRLNGQTKHKTVEEFKRTQDEKRGLEDMKKQAHSEADLMMHTAKKRGVEIVEKAVDESAYIRRTADEYQHQRIAELSRQQREAEQEKERILNKAYDEAAAIKNQAALDVQYLRDEVAELEQNRSNIIAVAEDQERRRRERQRRATMPDFNQIQGFDFSSVATPQVEQPPEQQQSFAPPKFEPFRMRSLTDSLGDFEMGF